MVLMTHSIQGMPQWLDVPWPNQDFPVFSPHEQSSHSLVPQRTLPWSRGKRLKQNVNQFQMISRFDRCISLKHTFPLRPATRCICETKRKPLRISSFQGNIQNGEAREESSKPILPKSSVQFSFLQPDKKETFAESSTAQDMTVVSASESNETQCVSHAAHGLFTRWLSFFFTEVPGQSGDDIMKGPSQGDHLQEPKEANAKERGEILKGVLCYILGLDATIMLPLLIFIPLFLAMNVVYGAEVSRELTPLWIIGPLVVALYVKLVRGIITLYAFSFKQTVKVIKNLPTYYMITHQYIAEGKLKEDIRSRFWQPVIDAQNLDYKDLSFRKWKAFEEWIIEKYLDFVESIWPYYCRTIRFLKRANLI